MLAVFDMGGVIARDFDAIKAVEDFLGKPLSALSPSARALFVLHCEGKLSEEEVWAGISRETPGFEPPSEPFFGRFCHSELDQGTVSLVNALRERGIRTVCATNVIPSHYEYHVRNGHYSFFDKVYASCEMGVTKPGLRFFRLLLEEERAKAGDVFFTDDSWRNVEAALSLGFHACLYRDAAKLKEDLTREGLA